MHKVLELLVADWKSNYDYERLDNVGDLAEIYDEAIAALAKAEGKS